MSRISLRVCFLLLLAAPTVLAEDPVFSGPQVGEPLPAFQMVGFFDDREGESFDLVEQAKGGPILIVFFHELTRPGFGLMRAIAKFASEREDKSITPGVVFLSDDSSETTKWASGVRRLFSDKVVYGVSPDGKEGPGAYGLNRNVTLTILVGDQGKVTANFALVQPQLQADGPAILKAIADVTGGGDIPSMDTLDPRYARRAEMQRGQANREMAQRGERGSSDPKLPTMLRAVINKQASEEQVQAAAAKVETYIGENESARKELARIVRTIVGSGKLENYGTTTAQGILKRWHEQLGETTKEDKPKR